MENLHYRQVDSNQPQRKCKTLPAKIYKISPPKNKDLATSYKMQKQRCSFFFFSMVCKLQ